MGSIEQPKLEGADLSALFSERLQLLAYLVQVGHQQRSVIQSGRMSELMSLLATKQQSVVRLSELSEQLRPASQQDPHQRHWDSNAQREQCRHDQQQCERLHAELLAIEAECEQALQHKRNDIQTQLQRADAGHQAATQYIRAEVTATAGSRLDLSSDQ